MSVRESLERGMKNPHWQCLLGNNAKRTTGWIESKAAHFGKHVTLKGEDGIWEVLAVYGPPRELADLTEKQRKDRGSLKSIKEE